MTVGKLIRIVFCLCVLLFATSSAEATNYFVKDDGNDSNTGLSDAQAWLTTAKVNGFSFSTGDDVYFKCDDTWTEQTLTIDWSGTSGNYVTIGAYYGSGTVGVSGNKPIIDGNNAAPSSEWYGLVQTTSSDYVEVKNVRIINSEGRGIRFEGTSGNHLTYLNLTGVETYNTYKNGIQYNYVDYGVADGCEVEGAAMCYPEVACRPWGGCFAIQHSSNITVQNCEVHEGYGEGIVIAHESHDCTIEENLVYGNRALQIYIGWGYNNIVRRNLCYGTTDTNFHRYTGFCGNGIGIQDEAWHANPATENNEVYNNLIAFCYSGISLLCGQVDGAFKDTEIVGNTIIDCSRGIALYDSAAEKSDNVIIKNNIVACYEQSCTPYWGATSAVDIDFDYNLWSTSVSAVATGANDVVDTPQLSKTSGWQSLAAGDLDGSEFELGTNSPCNSAGTSGVGQAYDDAALPGSTWPDNITTGDQDDYGAWEIGAFIGGSPVLTAAYPTAQQACTADPLTVEMGVTSSTNCNCKYESNATASCSTAYADLDNNFTTGQGTGTHSEDVSQACGGSTTYIVKCEDTGTSMESNCVEIIVSVATTGGEAPPTSLTCGAGGEVSLKPGGTVNIQ
jgi:parallel beta-helix repeat protein